MVKLCPPAAAPMDVEACTQVLVLVQVLASMVVVVPVVLSTRVALAQS
jgi:hypothetical protein